MDTPTPAILIVEDEAIVAADLQQSLNASGYDAYAIASSAEEAMQCAGARRPDVVLMDIRIRGAVDGIRAAALLKQEYSPIVIFLTAHADGPMIDRAKRIEPVGYLVKPAKEAELRSMIEIALYNRRLEAEREKLRAAEHRLHTITENVPLAIAYFDRQGRTLFANNVFREWVPYREDPIGVAASTVLGESLYGQCHAVQQQALLGEPASVIAEYERRGTLRKLEVTYVPDRGPSRTVTGVYAMAHDVTQREKLTADLRQAHLDLSTILNAIPASITSWRRDLTNRFVNEAARRELGVDEGQATGLHMRDLLGAERFDRMRPFVERTLAGNTSVHDEREDSPGGRTRYRQIHYLPEYSLHGVKGLHALSFDITELRQSHERIRGLAQRLERVREEERQAVAVRLHDGIAQNLFALKLGLDTLQGTTKQRTAANDLCVELKAALVRCVDDTRQIANELRPVTLATFGVAAAISQHARTVAQQSNLSIAVHADVPLPTLPETAQLLLFRAVQEALSNTAKHAVASRVDIRLYEDEGVTLAVADDGLGMPEGALQKPRAMGLLGLKERFESLGGSITITRNQPVGTRLSFHLPAVVPEELTSAYAEERVRKASRPRAP